MGRPYRPGAVLWRSAAEPTTKTIYGHRRSSKPKTIPALRGRGRNDREQQIAGRLASRVDGVLAFELFGTLGMQENARAGHAAFGLATLEVLALNAELQAMAS